MQIFRFVGESRKLNGDAGLSVLDQALKGRPAGEVDVAAASISSDSLLPTPTLSPLLLVSVFGYPLFEDPVQFVADANRFSTNVAVVPDGAVSNFTVASVKLVFAVPEISPVAVTA